MEPETAEPKPEKEKVTQVAKPAVEASAAGRRKSPEKVPDLRNRLDSGKWPRPEPNQDKKRKRRGNWTKSPTEVDKVIKS